MTVLEAARMAEEWAERRGNLDVMALYRVDRADWVAVCIPTVGPSIFDIGIGSADAKLLSDSVILRGNDGQEERATVEVDRESVLD